MRKREEFCLPSWLLPRFFVDGGCIGQDTREAGWGLVREIRNSNLGKSEVTVGQEGKACS